ncbi:MAG TPA: glycosyltransferase family 1 protein [Solirubrobacteraceae bacterium]|jgi:glycosyltransferase involved in cell wall biosynthesis|nr:glycosyltransferase family 1 protein [Solirubrobacteraceae bacterium]
MHGKRLRVGLAPGLAQLDPGTGHGKMWSSVLPELHKLGGVKLVDRGRADVWLASAHEPPPDGRPLVVQAHEAAWREPELRAILHPDFATALDTVTGATLAQAAAVIAPSDASRAQISAAYSFPLERVHSVHHGVDHRLFRPGLAGGRELAGGPYVLFVGVLHPRKNIDAVRRAVGDLASRGLPHILVIVGGPAPLPDAPEFEQAARAELPGHPNRVLALRGVPAGELAALMGGADAFCLPSVFEGFGLPALEAMACGAPVIVSDRGALPEVVDGAGLICSTDPAEVSAAVARVITEPELASQMRRAAIERAAGFSWARTAAGWLSVLRDSA